jgi:CRP-like cAMP-binding protein
MIIVDKILFLRRVSLFSKMTTEQLARLAGVASEAVYPAASRIIQEGEFGDRLFLIVDGEVLIHRGDTRLTVLKSEDYFGEMSIIDGEPRSASATAITDCLVLHLGHQDFKDILATNADVAWAVIRTLSQRLRETTSHLQEAKGAPTNVSSSSP